MMNDKLTPAQRKIAQTLRRLHAQKEPVNLAAVKRRHPQLLKTLGKIEPFWGWKRALRPAGLDALKRRGRLAKYPDENAVIAEIQHRVAAGLPVRCSRMLEGEHRDLALFKGARKCFGSWPAALRAAGFDPAKIRREFGRKRRIYPDGDAVVAGIQRRAAAGLPLSNREVFRGEQREAILVHNAVEYFGSWPVALRAAGVDAQQVRRELMHKYCRYPVPEAVIAEIQRRAAAGLPLRSSHLRRGKHLDSALSRSAARCFGSWPAALKAAGLEPAKVLARPLRYPDEKVVIAEIQRRAAAGLPPKSTDLCAGEHRDDALYRSAGKYFGSWHAALKAAGLEPAKAQVRPPRYPDANAVIAELRRRADAHLPLTCSGLLAGEHRDHALYSIARKHFGSWLVARKASGLDPTPVLVRPPRYPDAAAVVAEIQRRVAAGLPVSCDGLNSGAHRNRSLYWNGRRLFGSWPAARLAAGAVK